MAKINEIDNKIIDQNSLPNELFKDLAIKWAETTTFHGVGHILRSKNNIIRIIWINALLISSCLCFYQNIITVNDYFAYKKFSNTEMRNDGELRFPAVDICSLNTMNHFKQVVSGIREDFDEMRIKMFTKNFLFNQSVIQLFTINQLLIKCTFNSNECDEKDFYYYYDYDYGNCYSFNGPKTKWLESFEEVNNTQKKAFNLKWKISQTESFKVIKFSGNKNGLKLEMFINNEQVANDSDYIFDTEKSGIRLIVHDNEDYVSAGDQGTDLSPGFETNIGLMKRHTERLPHPYSDCITKLDEDNIKQNEILKRMNTSFGYTYYNQNFCLRLCVQFIFQKKCNCSEPSYPFDVDASRKYFNDHLDRYKGDSNLFFYDNLTDLKPCLIEKDLKCIKNIKETVLDFSRLESCKKSCPKQCSEIFFTEKISFSKYPTKTYSDMIGNSSQFLKVLEKNFPNDPVYLAKEDKELIRFDNITLPLSYKVMRKSLLKVNVYFESMNYDYIEESPVISKNSFISLLGGNLGLFLGASFLTIGELIVLVINFIYNKMNRDD
jgi:hypothetical protein